MASVAISQADQVAFLKKQANLVARLGTVATAQQRMLASMNGNYQDFDTNNDTVAVRDGYDSELGEELSAMKVEVAAAASSSPSTADSNSKANPALTLEHVYGYRAKGCRNNIALVDEDTIVYHAAGVAIVESISNNRQRCFTGHDGAIVCLAYNPLRRIVATGQLGPKGRACVWRVDDPAAGPILEVPFPNGGGVGAVAISPDGAYLVGVGLDTEHTIIITNIATGQQAAAPQRAGPDAVLDVAWNVDVRLESVGLGVITVGARHIMFWTCVSEGSATADDAGAPNSSALVGTPASLGRLGEQQTFTCVASTPEGTYVGCESGAVYAFNENRLVRAFSAHNGAVYTIRPRPAAPEILSGGRDGFVNVWEEISLRKIATFDMNGSDKIHGANGVKAISVSARDDGGATYSFIAGTKASAIYKISGAAFKQTTVISGHFTRSGCSSSSSSGAAPSSAGGKVWAVASHPTQTTVATAGDDFTIRLWDLTKHRQSSRGDFRAPVTAIAYSSEGSRIAAGFATGAVSILNSRNLIALHTLKKASAPIACVQFSPCGALLAAAERKGAATTVRLYSIGGGDKDVLTLAQSIGVPSSSASQYDTVTMDWSLDSTCLCVNAGQEKTFLKVGGEGEQYALAVVAAGDAVAASAVFATVSTTQPSPTAGTKVTAASPTPQLLASVDATGAVTLKKGGDGSLVATAVAHGPNATGVAFAFDGSSVVSSGSDGCVLQWAISGQ